MQRKTYIKSLSTPSGENISLLGSQAFPGEELSGEQKYWQERRRERDLPKVATESKTDLVGRCIVEYLDLGSQPTPSQNSDISPLAMAKYFNEKVAIDLKKWKGKHILHMVDMWSRLTNTISIIIERK